MAAYAGQAISAADIAAAAGCGVRALQLAFRQFRDPTPLAALQEMRLRAVRAAQMESDAPAAVRTIVRVQQRLTVPGGIPAPLRGAAEPDPLSQIR